MKPSVTIAVALLGATAAVAQTTGPATAPGTPGSMPSPEGMTSPPTGSSTPGTGSAGSTGSAGMAGDAMTEQAARQKLAGAGYGSVSNLKRNADGQWEAMMNNGSKQQRVTIGADGTVTPKSPQ